MKSAACRQQQHFLKIEKTFRIQAEQQKKLFVPGTKQSHASASEKSARASSARILADTGKDFSQLGRTVILQTSAPKINERIKQKVGCFRSVK